MAPPPPAALPPSAPQAPPPRRSRRKLAAIVGTVVVVLVLVVVLFVVPFPKQTINSTVAETSNGSTGEGIGASPFVTTSSGSVAVTWHASSNSVLAIIVVISGTCSVSNGTCATAFSATNVCISTVSTTVSVGVGTNSGGCSFSGGPGQYTVIALEVTGYSISDTVDYTAQVNGPIL